MIVIALVDVFADKIEYGAWRVEALDDDGGYRIKWFTGDAAATKARLYARQHYDPAIIVSPTSSKLPTPVRIP